MAHTRRPDPDTDPFKPPAIPTEVHCLHCGEEYDSYLIEWREEVIDGKVEGFWCCPIDGCDGKGFGFDIFPTDPEYRNEDGELMWSYDDDEEDDEEQEDFEIDGEYEFDPSADISGEGPVGDLPATPPRYDDDDESIPY